MASNISSVLVFGGLPKKHALNIEHCTKKCSNCLHVVLLAHLKESCDVITTTTMLLSYVVLVYEGVRFRVPLLEVPNGEFMKADLLSVRMSNLPPKTD
jgi:hypothetical protein